MSLLKSLSEKSLAAAGVGTSFIVVGLTAAVAWVPIAKYRSNKSLIDFCQQQETLNNEESQFKEKDILLVVNPNAGAGRSRKLFPIVLNELKRTKRQLEVYITKSAQDVSNLSRTLNLSKYKSVIVLAGDSTLYEMIQEPMSKNGGVWPYEALSYCCLVDHPML